MKTGENSHFEFLGQKVKILAYKCLIKLRRSWKLEEVHLIWRVMHVALGPTVVLTPEPTLWDVWFRRYEHFRKNFFWSKSRNFCFGALLRTLRPLKWIVICPTDDHWMIWDELETVCFGQELFFCIYMHLNLEIGQLVVFFTGGIHPAPKRLISEGGSFRVISSPMNAWLRDRRTGSPDQNWPV